MSPGPPRNRRRRLAIWFAGGLATVVLFVLFLGPGPFRVWKEQRTQTGELNARIEALEGANDRLRARAEQLRDPEAIKELARRDYGMVPKGSKAYAILPAPVPEHRPGGAWPFVDLAPESADP